MQDRWISEDYASLIFKYCNEHPDFTVKQLAKLVRNRNTEKKNRLGRTKKKTNGSEDDQII